MKKILVLSLLIFGCTSTQPTNTKKHGAGKSHEKNKNGNNKNKSNNNTTDGNTDSGTVYMPPPSSTPKINPPITMENIAGGCTVGSVHFDCPCSSLDTMHVRDTLLIRRK